MNNTTKMQKKRGLDALRGTAITGIVLYHMFPSAFPGGFLGVPLFFVLSGYLMFTTSSRRWEKGEFHAWDYYKKRIRKIFPPLFAMVMAVCCCMTLFQRSRMAGIRSEVCSIFLGYDNWWQIWQNASYFSKMTGASPFTHLWFLSLEMQFYLLWPVLFFAYQKISRTLGAKKTCFCFLGLALLSAGRMWFLYTPGEDPSRVYYGTDTMAFPLLTGMFLGAARQQYKNLCLPLKKNRDAAILSGLFMLVTCILFLTVDGRCSMVYRGGMFFISLFYAAFVCIWENQEEQVQNRPGISLMSLLGRKSYQIYLWHYPVIVLLLYGGIK